VTSSVIERAPEGDPLRVDLDPVIHATEKAGTLTRQLLAVCRAQVLQPRLVDLHETLRGMEPLVRGLLGAHASLSRTYGASPARILADPSQVEQVVMNLVVNARDAMEAGGCVTLETTNTVVAAGEPNAPLDAKPGRYVTLIASDTGAGMDDDTKRRIFEPFFTTKPIGVGTGLGLAICHNIITGMRGQISVDSSVGTGTTFRVVLPASATQNKPPFAAPSAKAGALCHGRVLVVDDDATVGMTLRRVLGGHAVTVVTTAQEALLRIAEGPEFDVILSDLMMPGMSGMDLHGVLARENPSMAARVVFVTGGAFTLDANAFLGRIANERIEKPFQFQELRAIVGKFVEQRGRQAAHPLALPAAAFTAGQR